MYKCINVQLYNCTSVKQTIITKQYQACMTHCNTGLYNIINTKCKGKLSTSPHGSPIFLVNIYTTSVTLTVESASSKQVSFVECPLVQRL